MMLLPDYRIRQRDYLLEIARAITQELNLDKLLQRIIKISTEMLAGQAGLIALQDDNGVWKVAASYGIPDTFIRSLDALIAEIPNEETPENLETDKLNQILEYLSRVARISLMTGVALPLIFQNKVIGLIFIFRNYSGVFSSNDRALLQSFADQAAIAVQNAKLYTQVSLEKRRLDAILDSAADGFIIMLPDHTIDRCNEAFSRLIGLPKSDIVGKKHSDIITWARITKGSTLEDAESGGWPLTPHATLYVEGDLVRKDNVPIPVGITYAPSLSADGKLLNIIASIRDITHFREAEELKSTFISVISHELKTPVALIKGYVGTLRREDASWDPEVVKDSLAIIEEEADRLTELIENLLDASRLQAGGLKLNLTDLALKPFIEKIIEKFKTQTDKHNFILDIPDNFPIVLADEDRVSQVISNLLSNAIKYSPQGGNIVISGTTKSNQVIICVKDEGPGIAQEDIPFIFDRFYRSKDASKATKGAGLGLYLTRAIVEAHGGKIWVDPKPGDGARICFSLPR